MFSWGSACFFFFSSRRRHTRFDCDWSSDVCSSDLDILLAATEACTNVLTHGGRKVRGYAVVTSLGAVGCQVEVADEGTGLAPAPGIPAGRGRPEAQPDPQQTPIAQLPESGRGLAVMRACVDNVTLDSRPGRGTVVTMRKRIRWPDDAPLRQLRAAS